MKTSTSNILAGLTSLAIAVGFVKGVDFLCYHPHSIEGKIENVQITPSGRGKSWNPDWLPVPGFDGRNYWKIHSQVLLTINSKKYTLQFYGCQSIPEVGENVRLNFEGYGEYFALEGNESRFSDETINLNYVNSYPAVKSLTKI
ncbi:hypothetical protein HYT23_04500 [Candidatus Pacearchaeota archaeon]|nr:hypothetical protein [Candidatus Pacearchaeota archaeon]